MVKKPDELPAEISRNLYTKRRKQGLIYGFSSAMLKVTRQRTCNWIGNVLRKITSPWTQLTLSKDQIRSLLKEYSIQEVFERKLELKLK